MGWGEVRACLGLSAAACRVQRPGRPRLSPFTEGQSTCGEGPTGCTEPQADNFNPSAFFDDGSCVFNAVSECPMDLTGDGIIGVSDVLFLLTYFGLFCD